MRDAGLWLSVNRLHVRQDSRTRGTHTFDLITGNQGVASGWEEHRKGESEYHLL